MDTWNVIVFVGFLFLIGYLFKCYNSTSKKQEKFYNESETESNSHSDSDHEHDVPLPKQAELPQTIKLESTVSESTPSTASESTPTTALAPSAPSTASESTASESTASESSEDSSEESSEDSSESGSDSKPSKKPKSQGLKTAERVVGKVAIDTAKKMLLKMGSGPFGWISLIVSEILKNVLNLDPESFSDCPAGYYQTDKLPKELQKFISVVPGLNDVFSLVGNKLCLRMGCSNDKFNQDGLCYSKCRDGYKNVGPLCWKTCGKDSDQGALCRERCRDGYKDIGGICYKNCDPGYIDMGISCVKK